MTDCVICKQPTTNVLDCHPTHFVCEECFDNMMDNNLFQCPICRRNIGNAPLGVFDKNQYCNELSLLLVINVTIDFASYIQLYNLVFLCYVYMYYYKDITFVKILCYILAILVIPMTYLTVINIMNVHVMDISSMFAHIVQLYITFRLGRIDWALHNQVSGE